VGVCDEEGAFRYMFCGKGKIETTMRISEGHEMSEKASM